MFNFFKNTFNHNIPNSSPNINVNDNDVMHNLYKHLPPTLHDTPVTPPYNTASPSPPANTHCFSPPSPPNTTPSLSLPHLSTS
jgi:hypothetical protein